MLASHINGQSFYRIRHQTNRASPPKVALTLTRHAQKPEHVLHEKHLSPLGGQLRLLKSRNSFVIAALELLNNPVKKKRFTYGCYFSTRFKNTANEVTLSNYFKELLGGNFKRLILTINFKNHFLLKLCNFDKNNLKYLFVFH